MIVGIVLGLLAAALVGLLVIESFKKLPARLGGLGAVFVVAVFVVVAYVAWEGRTAAELQAKDAGRPPTMETPQTADMPDPVHDAPLPRPEAETTESATQTTPQTRTATMATSLLDLPQVGQAVNARIDLSEFDAMEINGESFGRVLAYTCSTYCDGESPQVIEVTLGRKYTYFTAKAAVLDTSNGDYRIDVMLDGASPLTFAASPGIEAEIKLVVSGVSRLKIAMFASDEIMNPLLCGANTAVGKSCGELPGVALGDPMLTP